MRVDISFVDHESQVTMALLDDSGEEWERIDVASLGDFDHDADEVREAWERAILEEADWIRARDRGWFDNSPTNQQEDS